MGQGEVSAGGLQPVGRRRAPNRIRRGGVGHEINFFRGGVLIKSHYGVHPCGGPAGKPKHDSRKRVWKLRVQKRGSSRHRRDRILGTAEKNSNKDNNARDPHHMQNYKSSIGNCGRCHFSGKWAKDDHLRLPTGCIPPNPRKTLCWSYYPVRRGGRVD